MNSTATEYARYMAAGQRHAQAGEFAKAAGCILEAVRVQPGAAQAWHLLGAVRQLGGEHALALLAFQHAALLDESNAENLYALGRAHKQYAHWQSAINAYESAIALAPARSELKANALTSLGVVLRALGRTDQASEAYGKAIAERPGHAAARANLDALARAANVAMQSQASMEPPADLALQEADSLGKAALFAVGNQAVDVGRHWAEAGVRLAARSAQARSACADACAAAGDGVGAFSHIEALVALDPQDAVALRRGAQALASLGLDEECRDWCDRALALSADAATQLRALLACPFSLPSRAAIAEFRARHEAGLSRAPGLALQVHDPREIGFSPVFYLAYHGEANRDLNTRIGAVISQASPSVNFIARHCREPRQPSGRIRIGFLSRFLHAHSIGHTSRGLMAKLPRERFEVHALHLGSVGEDAVTSWIREHVEHGMTLPLNVMAAREAIAALRLDILFYQDVGMDLDSYLLGHARLAPVQCMSYGHPDTSGLPTMDWFISNDLYELPGAEEHYSERLLQLHDLPTLAYYFRPTTPVAGSVDRAEFGFDRDCTLYACPQTLFKLHPDFVAAMGEILRRDPKGQIALVEGHVATWHERLRERFARQMPDVAERIRFVPRMDPARFRRLIAAGDVILDTMHFNGMNTSLESLAGGAVVVTMPTALQRGRHTQAMYRKMGLDAPIASDPGDYVARAVALANDLERRRALQREIRERSHVLFEDRAVTAEFARAFESMVAQQPALL